MAVLSAKAQGICDRIQCGDGFVCNRNSPGRPCQGRVRQKIPRLIISVPTNLLRYVLLFFKIYIAYILLFS